MVTVQTSANAVLGSVNKDGREVGKRGRPAQRGRAARAKRQRK